MSSSISKQQKQSIERIALVAAVIQPLITIPQIIEIYGNKSAQDVSLITWLGYLLFGLVFLVYGAVFKLRPIFYGQILWVTMQLIVVIGIFIYG